MHYLGICVLQLMKHLPLSNRNVITSQYPLCAFSSILTIGSLSLTSTVRWPFCVYYSFVLPIQQEQHLFFFVRYALPPPPFGVMCVCVCVRASYLLLQEKKQQRGN